MPEAGLAKKKTLFLPEDKLTAVKSFLGARTEREAVVRSLEEVLWRKKLKEFLDHRPLKDFQLTSRQLAHLRRE